MNERPHANMQLLEPSGVCHGVTRSGGRTMCWRNISAQLWMPDNRGDGLVGSIDKDRLVNCIECTVNTTYMNAGYTMYWKGGGYTWRPKP